MGKGGRDRIPPNKASALIVLSETPEELGNILLKIFKNPNLSFRWWIRFQRYNSIDAHENTLVGWLCLFNSIVNLNALESEDSVRIS